jgi:HAD superfamily hydrolase (TIGR01490 family)
MNTADLPAALQPHLAAWAKNKQTDLPALALFDLDHTLIGGDSDVLWGKFLGERGLIDPEVQAQAHKRFYQEYVAGTLDIMDFLRFQLRILGELPMQTLQDLHRDFMAQCIDPILLPQAFSVIEWHRMQGHTLMIVTATNRFITGPIAKRFGVEHLIATEPEMIGGRYTGGVTGVPSFREGKVTRLNAWLAERALGLEHSWFYSDSHNDLPLLSIVKYPVAVDPDQNLAREAQERAWPIISLR